jgi:hemerythrin
MPEFTWKEELSVGNAMLDAEHKKLIDLVNVVEGAIRARNNEVLTPAFNLLVDSVSTHFENEEKFAQSINLPFEEHALEHQYVKNELLQMKNELMDINGRWSESAAEYYSYFLSEWFYQHLTEESKSMSVLRTHPYDFKPIA